MGITGDYVEASYNKHVENSKITQYFALDLSRLPRYMFDTDIFLFGFF